jgi:hypothetical protein
MVRGDLVSGAISAPSPPGSAAHGCRPRRRRSRCTSRTSNGGAAGRRRSRASSRRSPRLPSVNGPPDADRPRCCAGGRARHPPPTRGGPAAEDHARDRGAANRGSGHPRRSARAARSGAAARRLGGGAPPKRAGRTEVADLNFEPEGVVLTIRRSKTDREGAGATVAIPLGGEEATCPVLALRRWLEAAAIGNGRVFRRVDRHGRLGPTLSDRALAEIAATERPLLDSKATSPDIRCALDSRRRRPGPAARTPRLCATGVGRACRSLAAISARVPAGTIIQPRTSDCNRFLKNKMAEGRTNRRLSQTEKRHQDRASVPNVWHRPMI